MVDLIDCILFEWLVNLMCTTIASFPMEGSTTHSNNDRIDVKSKMCWGTVFNVDHGFSRSGSLLYSPCMAGPIMNFQMGIKVSPFRTPSTNGLETVHFMHGWNSQSFPCRAPSGNNHFSYSSDQLNVQSRNLH